MIKAVLLDADGVVQAADPEAFTKLKSFAGKDGEAFTQDLFASEQPAAVGAVKFVEVLETVMARWNLQVKLDKVLELWRRIDVIDGLSDLTGDLQRQGLQVALATNQQDERMRYMETALGYGECFDQCFFSCALGVKKPTHEFFLQILESLELSAEDCLFVDDSPANVASAKEMGIHAELFQFSTPARGAEELRALLKNYVSGLE